MLKVTQPGRVGSLSGEVTLELRPNQKELRRHAKEGYPRGGHSTSKGPEARRSLASLRKCEGPRRE